MRISFDTFNFIDTNAETVALTGDNRVAVQRKSKIKFSFSASSSEGDIDRYELFIGDDEPKITIPASWSSYTRAIYDAKRIFVKCVAYDVNGNNTMAGGWLDVIPYTSPSVAGSAQRINNFESETQISADATVSDINGKNASLVSYRYRKAGETVFGDSAYLTSGETAVVSLDRNFPWEIEFKVTDKFESSVDLVQIAKGTPIVFVDRVKRSASVGEFPAHEDSFETKNLFVNGAQMHPIAPLYKSATVTASAVNTEGTILNLQLPKGKFLVFGSVQSSIGGTAMQSATLTPSTNATRIAGQMGRGSMNGGGGTNVWSVFELSDTGVVRLESYNYHSNNNYQWYGHVFAIQLDE